MIGKKCPLGSVADCTDKCAWFVDGMCAVRALALAGAKLEKPEKPEKRGKADKE